MTDFLQLDIDQVLTVAETADEATHAHLDAGWGPPERPTDHFAFLPVPGPPSAAARYAATVAELNQLSALGRRELCWVMNLGRRPGRPRDCAGSIAAFRAGRVGSDEAGYLAGKADLSEYLRKGLAKLGA